MGSVAGAQELSDHSRMEETAFVVTLAEDGSAEVSLRLSIDLNHDRKDEALEQLRENRSSLKTQFRTKLEPIVARTAEKTGRPMRITATTVAVSTNDSSGMVELSASWVGLAKVEGHRLVLREPFASRFSPPGRFVIRGPEGYSLVSSAVEPQDAGRNSAAWGSGSSLDGFRVTFKPTDGAEATDSQPLAGFGFLPGLLSLVVVLGYSLFARWR